MEIETLAKNVGLEVEDFHEIFEIYLETTTSDLKELKTALQNGDAEKVNERAHSIRGASGNLGLNELCHLAKEIEGLAKEASLGEVEDLVRNFSEKYEDLTADFENSRCIGCQSSS